MLALVVKQVMVQVMVTVQEMDWKKEEVPMVRQLVEGYVQFLCRHCELGNQKREMG